MSVCVHAPTLTAPLAGMLADRVRPQWLLVGLNATMAAVVATLLAVRSAADVWLIFAVMAVYGAALTVTDPAESALFAVMLPTGLRQRINGLRLTLTEGGKLTAPLLGAGLFALLGGGPVAAIDAATFVVAAFTTSRLRVSEPSPEDVVSHRPEPEGWHPEADVPFFDDVDDAVTEAKRRADDGVVTVCDGDVAARHSRSASWTRSRLACCEGAPAGSGGHSRWASCPQRDPPANGLPLPPVAEARLGVA